MNRKCSTQQKLATKRLRETAKAEGPKWTNGWQNPL